MEEDSKKVCFKKKLELVWHTSAMLVSAMRSYQISVEKKSVLLRIMVKEAGGFDHPSFSDFHEFFKDLDDCTVDAEKIESPDLPLGILIEKDSFFDANSSDPLNSEILDTFLNAGFDFSDDPEAFLDEFFTVAKVFSVVEEASDPRVDLAAMKALFHAGRMIERLEHEGKKRSDVPTKAGSTQHKNYVPHEGVIQTAKDVVEDFKRHGIKPQKEAVKRTVIQRLVKSEKEKENPKDVYGMDSLKEILKDVWSDIL